MGFELKETKQSVIIYGKSFELKQPKVKDAIHIRKKIQESNEEDSLLYMIDYVEPLGVPRDVLEDMETTHFISLVNYLANGDQKKTV